MRSIAVALAVVAFAASRAWAGGGDDDPPMTGAVSGGVYTDSDRTVVLRSLALAANAWGPWSLSGSAGVDVVSSASVDVRSSPQIDALTGASQRTPTTRAVMTDRRSQVTADGAWNDSRGRAADLTGSAASERDYTSVSAGANGSIDLLDRTLTLLGGISVTDNWISSVLDPTFHRKMFATGWSAGVARVLTPDDALRVRYDGRAAEGYQASPYRFVRFGDWTTGVAYDQQIIFSNTIGPAGGLPETVPGSRVSHAIVLEWVHALGDHAGIHPAVRAGRDSWGVDSVTASIDLRVTEPRWRLQLGYRYYLQTAASFFEDKYALDPSMYPHYTSDKELGWQTGHLVDVGLSVVLKDAGAPGERRVLLDARVDGFRYAYPGFVFLPQRTSLFASLGLTWEL